MKISILWKNITAFERSISSKETRHCHDAILKVERTDVTREESLSKAFRETVGTFDNIDGW